jgi:hypothetical protein
MTESKDHGCGMKWKGFGRKPMLGERRKQLCFLIDSVSELHRHLELYVQRLCIYIYICILYVYSFSSIRNANTYGFKFLL